MSVEVVKLSLLQRILRWCICNKTKKCKARCRSKCRSESETDAGCFCF